METIQENNVKMKINDMNDMKDTIDTLTNEDIKSMINILDICCQRGSFRINLIFFGIHRWYRI